jgi:hypothetical protein
LSTGYEAKSWEGVLGPDPAMVPDQKRSGERAFVTAQFMLVAALSMLFLAGLLNLIVIQYAQGVVRAALDEGVRMGTPAPATSADCLAAIDRVMADLMGGPLGAGVSYSCLQIGGELVASADSDFHGWFPGFPNIQFHTEVSAVKESDE